MPKKGDELVDLELRLHHETHPESKEEGAILVSDDGDREKAVWLPKSQVEFDLKGRNIMVTLPAWLANDKGLI